MRRKRLVIRVVWRSGISAWVVRTRARVLGGSARKADAIRIARSEARRNYAAHGLAQVVVHNKDGRISFENTYGKDPIRSPG